MNIQPIEKAAPSDGRRLELHSMFPTIQGEGPLSGTPCVFTRLAGCNLQCPGCDTEYSNHRHTLTVEALCAILDGLFRETCNPHRFVVITGGEPFRQNIAPFVAELLAQDTHVQIETNGTMPVSNDKSPMWLDPRVTIVCSPKTGRVQDSVQRLSRAYKYVIHHESVDEMTGLPLSALGHKASPYLARPPAGKLVYMQPMDCGNSYDNEKNMQAGVRSSMRHGYILQGQMHKLWGIE